MIKCEKHGLSFMVVVCEHLSDAMAEQVFAKPVPLANQYDEVYLLCEACCADLHIPPEHGWLDDDRESALFEPRRIKCLCEECLAAWIVDTKQSTIDELVEEARRRSRAFRTSSG